MIILGYLISFLTGFFLIQLIVKNQYPLKLLFHLSLSILLGLGINATVTFYSLLIAGKYLPNLAIAINLLFLIILNILFFINVKRGHIRLQSNSNFHPLQLFGLLLWMVIGFAIYLISTNFPFGDWDAWAIWNMKAKFIMLGGERWQVIFNQLSWHTHPDYPLLLPTMHAWIYSFTHQGPYPISMVTAIFFSLLIGILFYSSLEQFNVKRRWCFLFATLLLSHPYYSFLTTLQYADIVLAGYLLASIVCLILLIRTRLPSLGLIAGLLLGLMTFTKNEGLVMALFLGIFSCLTLLTNRESSFNNRLRLIGFFGLGFVLTASATFILKCFLVPTSGDIASGFSWNNVVHCPIERYSILFNEIKRQFFVERKWCFIWIFLLITYLSSGLKIFYRENKILTAFIICYVGMVMGVYLYTQHNVDLQWWLDTSLNRILLTILPATLFIGFYLHWRPESLEQK